MEIVTSPDKISVFIDGKAVLANVELAEKRTPLLALESGVADVSVKDITLYNVLPDGSGTGKPNPETGAALPVVAVTVAAAATVGAAVSMRKKRAEA